MRKHLVCVATAIAILFVAGAAKAQPPVYSYETTNLFGPDGFFGLGATVTQDTIGATDGTHSMKYVAGEATFVGARTETVIPATLNDPPGVDYILFDMTLTEPYAGTFADIGVTVFGHALNAPGGAEFGHQVQFADSVPIGGRAAGTYTLGIKLNQSVGPYRAGESFNQIFGPGPTDLTVASAFQFFISKNAGNSATIYIDNVRLGIIPEPSTLAIVGLGTVALTGFSRRRTR